MLREGTCRYVSTVFPTAICLDSKNASCSGLAFTAKIKIWLILSLLRRVADLARLSEAGDAGGKMGSLLLRFSIHVFHMHQMLLKNIVATLDSVTS